ncbi:hypothetical protein FE782_12390 [Paenibacillus antri]|uniref:Uncharacterized protein n=1 Tax=Paenibacillus antri TaxID=2582848 RepID=A0A5R9GDI0_9BACL|nr:hypothetical protein [Paenibacillus antri]TLS52150.1 hypothetical protein FE782_12390 [Paenibacillus antri]
MKYRDTKNAEEYGMLEHAPIMRIPTFAFLYRTDIGKKALQLEKASFPAGERRLVHDVGIADYCGISNSTVAPIPRLREVA